MPFEVRSIIVSTLTSDEIRKQKRDVDLKIRELYALIEKKKREQQDGVVGSPEWAFLGQEIEAHKVEITHLNSKVYELNHQLFVALKGEKQELQKLSAKMATELKPKIDSIIGKAEKSLEGYAEQLSNLCKGYGQPKDHIALNIDLKETVVEHNAREVALSVLTNEVRTQAMQKHFESETIYQQNGCPKEWRK